MTIKPCETIAGLALALLLATPAFAADRRTLQGHVPAGVAQFNLQPVGRLAATDRLQVGIKLPMHNRDALMLLLKQLYDPTSTNFHHYLTTPEFTERFGPTVIEYQAVKDFARSNRLVVESTYDNRALLDVSGSVADIEAAFQTTLHTYRHPTENREFYAPDREPSVDAGLPISELDGLDNYALPRPGGGVGSPDLAPGGKPGAGSGPSGEFLGYDFRKAYAPNVTLNGTGQIVALFELDGFYQSDIAAYETLAGLPPLVPTVIKVGSFNGVPSTNYNKVGEVSLDIELAISMAPNLDQMRVYEGNNTVSILTQIASDNVAKQISSSWFFGRATTNDYYLLEFAAQGQSFFQCSGDNLAYTNGITFGPNSGPPSDDPYLTSVGGTILTTASDDTYTSEKVWINGNGINGSGGGISTAFSIPTWQQGVNMSGNQGSTTQRNIPDVSMVAYYCVVISNNGSTNWFWGTSLAAPLWAGFTALVNQQAALFGKPYVGYINPAIYDIAQSPLYASCFHDITNGNNTWVNSPTHYSAVPGYDLCTGWGSPTGINLINALVNYSGPCFVNFNYSGSIQNGSYSTPYKTLAQGTNFVATGGTIFIETGGSSSETMTIKKPMTITAIDGAATVGH